MSPQEPRSGSQRLGQDASLEERLQRLAKPMVRGARFEREGMIAKGGMGVVHRVRDLELDRALALKELAPAAAGDAKSAARFYEEAQVTAQLDHPGIVPIHELGMGPDGNLYFAMKLVLGRDLRAILELARTGAEGWNQTRVLGVLLKVCEATAYAHSKGVIHRDLKPGNVMVGHFGEVYVMDWGLARVMGRKDVHDIRLKLGEEGTASVRTVLRDEREESDDSPLVTMDGTVVGTPCYMPPEQARGDIQQLSPRSDVYSIGAMLYHLLSGRTPYVTPGVRASNHTVLARVIDGPPQPILALARNAPVELVAITEKAMARQPAQRYPDTLALAEDLRSYLEGRVVLAHETGALAELKKWVARNRGIAFSGAAAVLALLGGFVISFSLYLRAEEKTVLAATETTRADAKAREADRRAEEVLRLSALQKLDDLVAEAKALWPIEPESVAALESWLARARELVQAIPEHAHNRAELAASATDGDRWWHDQLTKLIEGLTSITDEATGLASTGISPEHGWGVARRLEFAKTVKERSVAGPDAAARWSAAIASVRDAGECPWYRGLELTPQVGLLPLGPDPEAGLWEFAHLQSGEPPERGPDGKLVLQHGVGLVLVLLPGGTFRQGAQRNPALPNYDPQAGPYEHPTHEVRCSPFLLSKYEMTQGQWKRITGKSPSLAGPEDRLPVEQVSWFTCVEVCRQMGLDLPSEAQWEYAARGDTSSPWWSGDDPAALADIANLADQTRARGFGAPDRVFESWDDRFDTTARIGVFAPNPFGLHDVCGNVWEWCRDGHVPYPSSKEPLVDPLVNPILDPKNSERRTRVYRGGSFMDASSLTRSASRFASAPDLATNSIGLRPVRRLTP